MTVVVVGAGITGLAAALALQRAGAAVVVLEGRDRPGGVLQTTPVAGVALDAGAEAFLVRVPEATRLAGDAGLGADVVHPVTSVASLWIGGRLVPLPPRTLLGVPSSLAGLPRVLGPWGTARAAADLLGWGRPVGGPARVAGAEQVPAHPPAIAAPGADIAVADLVTRRLGPRVTARLVDPLLGGVYAGRAAGLSLAATVPALVPAARRSGSLLRQVRRLRPPASGAPVFGTLREGLGSLAVTLAGALDVRLSHPVTAVQADGAGFLLRVGSGARARQLRADAVVLAVPAAGAARLLAPWVALGGMPAASVAIVSLAYDRAGVPDRLHGSGFLVPPDQRRLLKAATFSSHKWPHLAAREPFLVRTSAGRFGDIRGLQVADGELAGVLAAELATATGLRGRPADVRVTRWGGALPQYLPGHLERVAHLRSALPAGLVLAGAAYDGVGVPACIRSGQTAAAQVLDRLGVTGSGGDNENRPDEPR